MFSPAARVGSRALSIEVRASRLGMEKSSAGSLSSESSGLSRCQILYDRALRFARHKNYKGARRAFQTCVGVDPDFSKAWVSWAQMEKRTQVPGEEACVDRCRKVLQRGLTLNPTDAKLLQAWGLLELQRGNVLAAVLLLERCVQYEPRCSPVLQWRIVQAAKQSVGDRIRRQLQDHMPPQVLPIPVRNDRDPPIAMS